VGARARHAAAGVVAGAVALGVTRTSFRENRSSRAYHIRQYSGRTRLQRACIPVQPGCVLEAVTVGTRPSDPTLPWHSLTAALGAGGRVDRVELKTILDVELEQALSVLDMRVQPPQLRLVHYLDTPDLALYRRGIIVRTRMTDGVGADVVVKLRGAAPQAQRRIRGLVTELDVLPDVAIWSASIKRRLRPRLVQASIGRGHPARRLLSRSQRALLRTATGDGFDIGDLIALGPVNVVRLTSGEFENRIDVESWLYPDGSHVVELSAKCRPARSRRVAEALRELIVDRRIVISRQQTTKTQILMQRLASR
jgi:hypothetical protein